MSSKTKSFNSYRLVPRRGYSASSGGVSAQQPAQGRPPIMPSTATTQKLKAFQFVDGAPELMKSGGVDKENRDERNTAPPTLVSKPLATPAKPSRVESVVSEKKGTPSTPENASRLPLNQLIGHNSSSRAGMVIVQQEEELLWKHTTPISSQPAATPARKGKRPRSSSPPSASAVTRAQSNAFRTPKQDPAGEVWSRYHASNGDSAVHASQNGIENLLIHSSPRSSATAGSVGGLRRYNSCGYQWPTSKKKRKTRHAPQDLQLELVESEGDEAIEEAEVQKVSKVSLFLEEAGRIRDRERQESLPRELQDEARAPSSPSPAPAPPRRLSDVVEEELPPKILPASTAAEGHVHQDKKLSQTVLEDEPRGPVYVPLRGSSEFSDFDMDGADMDLLERLTVQQIIPDAVAPSAKNPVDSLPAKLTSQPVQQTEEQRHEDPVRIHGEDEFDEFDDDDAVSDSEWAQAAIMVEQQTQQQQAATEFDQTGAPSAPECRQTDLSIFQEPSSDEFGDDIDLDDFDTAEAMATQALQGHTGAQSTSGTRAAAIQRYLITVVQEGIYTDEHGRGLPEKVLVLEAEKATMVKTAKLRQSWFDTPCSPKSYVHIIGQFDYTGQCIVDNAQNMIILHPDHLISATSVADSFGCLRRAVLQDRVKATGQASPPMFYGTLIHEIFQEALKLNAWDLETLEGILTSLLPRCYESMAELSLNTNQIREYLTPKLLEMGSWANLFVQKTPQDGATLNARNGQKCQMSINKLLDIEEHIWSPNYGLKGNIDATVQVALKNNGSTRTLTVPLEVKTGKRISESHQAQTALYTLLVSDRYDLDVTDGVLYYTEFSNTVGVQAMRHELIHLIMKRNELASYVRERLQLPPILEPNRQRLCNGCYAQTTCYLYHKLSEEGTGELIDKKEKFESLVQVLKPIHQIFFQKWDYLITKEESEMMKFRRELWTMVSSEREKVNRCFGNVIIEPGSSGEQSAVSKINRYQYTFIKPEAPSSFSFAESQIGVGEPIVVSDEKGHFALANGYVTHIHKKRITVAVDRRLHNARVRNPGFNSQDNQSFTGIMEVGICSTASKDEGEQEPIRYRLDKDEFSNGMATVRNNMLQIMDDSVFRAEGLRKMIIEGDSPNFKPSASDWVLASQSGDLMNVDQKAAIEKVMSAQDYALVLGMPGTGKTTTIAQIIRCLVAKGKSVLLTSYTHTAVDNILLKIRHAGFQILRLGVQAKIHPEVQEFAILASQPKESLEEVQESWQNPPVVATTCLGVNHPLFSQRVFDYCIVDEASQITMPVCLGPIRMAKSFILVGDHFQLPPLVQNKEAQEGGLDMSLFRLLSEQHPDAVVSLEHQYRMCADIMSLANALIYSGRLKCGNNAVATRSLILPKADEALHKHHSTSSLPSTHIPQYICVSPSSPSCHLSVLLDPSVRVLFLNTDTIGPLANELSNGNRTTNPLEAALATQIAHILLSAGLRASDLGIITFYRSQLALLRQHLRSIPSLELHTADKFQGRDKEAVLVSFVRSNADSNVGELLKDWRRINVAVTRARSKLIILGSAKTLSGGGDVLNGLVRMCKDNGWWFDLQPGVGDGHVWPGMGASQIDESQRSTILPRAAAAAAAAAGGDVIGCASPARQRTSGPRAPLDDIEGNVLLSPGRKGLKMPDNVGRVGLREVLGQKAVMRDILNDVL